MNIRQISISEFKAHCTEEIREVEKGNVILQVTRHGKPVATVEPSKAPAPVSLASWLGSGRGTVTVASDEVLTSPVLAWHDEAQNVWEPLTAEQHAERQGRPRATTWEQLLGDGTEEEWAGFDEALELWRSEPIQPYEGDS